MSDDPDPWLIAALAGSVYDGAALAARHAKPAAYARLAAVATTDASLLGFSKLRGPEELSL